MIQPGSIVRLINGQSDRMVVDTIEEGRATCAWFDKDMVEHRMTIAVASLWECLPLMLVMVNDDRYWREPLPDGRMPILYRDVRNAPLPKQYGSAAQDLTGVMMPPGEPFPEVSIMPKPFSH